MMRTCAFAVLVLLTLAASGAIAGTVDITTIATNTWTVSAGGGTPNQTPYYVPVVDRLSITDTGWGSGTYDSGSTLANFTGYWTAQISFILPADAINISMTLSNMYADDRTILYMNGNLGDLFNNSTNIVGDGGYLPGASPTYPYAGNIVYTNNGSNVAYTFTGNGVTSTTVNNQSLFNAGGSNTLLAMINNTTNGVLGNNEGLDTVNGGNVTDFYLQGTITYDEASVPEPCSAGVLATALFGLAAWRYRSRRTAR